jgi:hypothetical protein
MMPENRTWMPMAAGILDIVAGCLGLLVSLVFVSIGAVARYIPDLSTEPGMQYLFPIFALLAFPFAILGILAIVGGIFALRRKIWGLALTGSIAALFPCWILGLPAIVFTALSKNEFE